MTSLSFTTLSLVAPRVAAPRTMLRSATRDRPRPVPSLPTARAAGISGAVVIGAIDDSLGHPISDVQVELLGTSRRTRSNESGRFRFDDLPRGGHRMIARRLGFEPLAFTVDVMTASDTVSVALELHASVTELERVRVEAKALPVRLREVGFDGRRRNGAVPPSQFITKVDIEKRNPIVLSQMLRAMTGRAQTCANGWVYINGLRMSVPIETDAALMDSSVQRAAAVNRVGGAMAALSFDATPPARAKEQVDLVAPRNVAGMEVYVGSAQIPPQFKTPGRANSTAACVILIWTD